MLFDQVDNFFDSQCSGHRPASPRQTSRSGFGVRIVRCQRCWLIAMLQAPGMLPCKFGTGVYGFRSINALSFAFKQAFGNSISILGRQSEKRKLKASQAFLPSSLGSRILGAWRYASLHFSRMQANLLSPLASGAAVVTDWPASSYEARMGSLKQQSRPIERQVRRKQSRLSSGNYSCVYGPVAGRRPP
jgi:hypothetical protein